MKTNLISFAKIGDGTARKKLKGRSVIETLYNTNIQFARERQKIISLFIFTEGMSFFEMGIKKGRRKPTLGDRNSTKFESACGQS